MDFKILGFDQSILKEISLELSNVTNSGFWSGGPFITKLENKFCSFYDMEAVSCSSGGMALELIANVFPEIRKIAVQSNTYFASILPWLNRNKEIVLIGSKDNELTPSLEHIKEAVLLGVNAIVLTHIGGYPIPEIRKISDFCKEKGVLLIEDCAHSPLTKIKDNYVGTFGNASILSFFPTKPIPAGEGGLVLIKDKKLAEKMKIIRDYGKEKKEGKIFHKLPAVSNGRLNEFSAAVVTVFLKNYEKIRKHKESIANIYNKFLPKELIYQQNNKFKKQLSFYKYITLIESNKYAVSPVYDKENQLYSILKDNDVKFKFIGDNHHGVKHICLPIFPNMNEFDAKNIINACKF